jgi:hypothetical protein
MRAVKVVDARQTGEKRARKPGRTKGQVRAH